MMSAQKRGLRVLFDAVTDAIRETGEAGIPNGFLYRSLQSILGPELWTLETHCMIVTALKDVGAITEEHNVLRAVA